MNYKSDKYKKKILKSLKDNEFNNIEQYLLKLDSYQKNSFINNLNKVNFVLRNNFDMLKKYNPKYLNKIGGAVELSNMTLKEYLNYLLQDIYSNDTTRNKDVIINEIVETLIKDDVSNPTEFIKNFLQKLFKGKGKDDINKVINKIDFNIETTDEVLKKERLAKEEADKKAKDKEEADKKAKDKEEADKKAKDKEEADKKAKDKEEADKKELRIIAKEQAKEEADKKELRIIAKEEAKEQVKKLSDEIFKAKTKERGKILEQLKDKDKFINEEVDNSTDIIKSEQSLGGNEIDYYSFPLMTIKYFRENKYYLPIKVNNIY